MALIRSLIVFIKKQAASQNEPVPDQMAKIARRFIVVDNIDEVFFNFHTSDEVLEMGDAVHFVPVGNSEFSLKVDDEVHQTVK